MSMPIFGWAAYVHRASVIQNADTLNMILAAGFPHMEKADRMKVIAQLEEPIVVADAPPSKEEWLAQMAAAGIGLHPSVEVN